MRWCLTLLALTLLIGHSSAEPESFVADGAKLEKLWGDGTFTEGPVLGPDGCIYFSDIGNRIMKYDPAKNDTTVFRNPSGRSNGLKFDAKGRLLACEGANTGGGRRVSITEADGKIRSVTDNFMGKKYNSPNDLTLDRKGRIYFTDPRYGGNDGLELDQQSVYRIDTDDKVTRIIDDVKKPNGLVISPDQKTLYLAENNPADDGQRLLLAYPLKEDGSVGTRKVLHDFKDDRGIDGMCIDTEGRVYATAGKAKTAGVTIFSPDGKKLGFIATPEDPTNVCWGGKDLSVLYITGGKSIYRIQTTVKGFSTIK